MPGENPELSYPIDRQQRYTGDIFDSEHKIFRRSFPHRARAAGREA